MVKATYPPIAEAAILAQAQAQALREIKRRLRDQAMKPLTYATLSRLAIELVQQRPELVAEALELVRQSSPQLPRTGTAGDGPSKIKTLQD